MSKCWYCNNELTTGDNPKHFGICNNCYDEINKEFLSAIKDWKRLVEIEKTGKEQLKQQLEDKEKEHELLINDFEEETEKLRKQIKQESDARERFVEEVKNLKEQLQEQIDYKDEYYHYWQETKKELAKKDAELEKITRIVAYRDNMDRATVINGVKFSDEQIITLQNIDYFADKHNQDKIEFAVEQLEQTRKLVDELLDNCRDKQYKVWEVFDNQINELKGGDEK